MLHLQSKQIWCMHMTVYDIIWLHVGFCHVYSFTMHIVCHLQVCFEIWLVLFSSPHGSSKYCIFLRAIHIPTGSQWKRTPSLVRWICWFLSASTVFEARSQHTWHTPCAPCTKASWRDGKGWGVHVLWEFVGQVGRLAGLVGQWRGGEFMGEVRVTWNMCPATPAIYFRVS